MDNDDQIFIAIHWYRLYDLQASHVQRATSTMARLTPMRSVPVFFQWHVPDVAPWQFIGRHMPPTPADNGEQHQMFCRVRTFARLSTSRRHVTSLQDGFRLKLSKLLHFYR